MNYCESILSLLAGLWLKTKLKNEYSEFNNKTQRFQNGKPKCEVYLNWKCTQYLSPYFFQGFDEC